MTSEETNDIETPSAERSQRGSRRITMANEEIETPSARSSRTKHSRSRSREHSSRSSRSISSNMDESSKMEVNEYFDNEATTMHIGSEYDDDLEAAERIARSLRMLDQEIETERSVRRLSGDSRRSSRRMSGDSTRRMSGDGTPRSSRRMSGDSTRRMSGDGPRRSSRRMSGDGTPRRSKSSRSRSRDHSSRSSRSISRRRSSSSKMDEYFDNEEATAQRSSSIATGSTAEITERSGLERDTLAPLRESTSFRVGRTSTSAAFSLGTSDIDSSFQSTSPLDISMYNRLAATAMEEACERKAQLCCGSCCDLVKGCIIANAVQMVLLTVVLLIVAIPNEAIGAEFDPLISKTGGRIIAPIGILVSAIGILGAVKFYKWPVLVAGIVCLIQFLLGCIVRSITLTLGSAIFAYPNIHLFLALHSQKITRENYNKTERYCCCCPRKRGSDEGDCCS